MTPNHDDILILDEIEPVNDFYWKSLEDNTEKIYHMILDEIKPIKDYNWEDPEAILPTMTTEEYESIVSSYESQWKDSEEILPTMTVEEYESTISDYQSKCIPTNIYELKCPYKGQTSFRLSKEITDYTNKLFCDIVPTKELYKNLAGSISKAEMKKLLGSDTIYTRQLYDSKKLIIK